MRGDRYDDYGNLQSWMPEMSRDRHPERRAEPDRKPSKQEPPPKQNNDDEDKKGKK